jgi:hypothetical protein
MEAEVLRTMRHTNALLVERRRMEMEWRARNLLLLHYMDRLRGRSLPRVIVDGKPEIPIKLVQHGALGFGDRPHVLAIFGGKNNGSGAIRERKAREGVGPVVLELHLLDGCVLVKFGKCTDL